MPAAGAGDLLLFVAGEPDSGVPSVRNASGSFAMRVGGALMPPGLFMKPAPGPSPAPDHAKLAPTQERSLHLPPQQIYCVNTVLEAARREGRKVTVVDVDQPAGRQDLVDRWVGPDDVLPLLVRPDGARLEGDENFSPRKVRRFIDGP